jgi:hypothetical protein
MLERDPRILAIASAGRQTLALAAGARGIRPLQCFGDLHGPRLHDLFVESYSESLVPDGFRLDTDRQHALIYRKALSCGRWDFFFADSSDCDGGSNRSVRVELGLALPVNVSCHRRVQRGQRQLPPRSHWNVC